MWLAWVKDHQTPFLLFLHIFFDSLTVSEHFKSIQGFNLTATSHSGIVSQFTGGYTSTLPNFKLLTWSIGALGSLESQLSFKPPKIGIFNYCKEIKTLTFKHGFWYGEMPFLTTLEASWPWRAHRKKCRSHGLQLELEALKAKPQVDQTGHTQTKTMKVEATFENKP